MIGTIFSPDVVKATQFVVPSINGHNPDLEPYPYDPEQAKALIAAAAADGVPVEDEITMIGRPGGSARTSRRMKPGSRFCFFAASLRTCSTELEI